MRARFGYTRGLRAAFLNRKFSVLHPFTSLERKVQCSTYFAVAFNLTDFQGKSTSINRRAPTTQNCFPFFCKYPIQTTEIRIITVTIYCGKGPSPHLPSVKKSTRQIHCEKYTAAAFPTKISNLYTARSLQYFTLEKIRITTTTSMSSYCSA